MKLDNILAVTAAGTTDRAARGDASRSCDRGRSHRIIELRISHYSYTNGNALDTAAAYCSEASLWTSLKCGQSAELQLSGSMTYVTVVPELHPAR